MKSQGHIWNDDWLIENFDKFEKLQELTDEYNRLFGTCYTRVAVNRHTKERLGLSKNYTKEEKDWFMSYYPKHGVEETRIEMARLFNRVVSNVAINHLAWWLGVQVDEDIASRNKRRVLEQEGSKRKTREIGGTHTCSGKYIRMKTSEHEWKTAGVAIWEQHNGPIPDGYKVTYLDRNPQNYRIDNLAIISHDAFHRFRGFNPKSTNPEINRTIIAWCELMAAISKAERRRNG